ncbi:MAG TPA: CBS domain-containing protein [Azospirillum sp.]|nr:CBS domain-containing protein [Azospirillum sp.]
MAERQEKQPEQPQRTAQRAEEVSRKVGEAGQQVTETAAQESGQAIRQSGEAAQRGMVTAGAAASDITRRGAEALGESARHLADTAAEQIQHFGEALAQASRDVADNTRLFMTVSNGKGLQEWQQATSSLMEQVAETNARIAQELLQRSSPAELVSLQQRFLRDYLQTVTIGSRSLFRAAQHLAEEAAQPLERQRLRIGGIGRGRGTVADVMSRDVRMAEPDNTVQEVARIMTEEDTGALPVREGDRLVGMVTDRDIATRLVAEGKDPSRTRVREVMTPEVRYVYEDEDLDHVAENMAEQQVRRLPVMNRQKRLVGILSLGDMATHRAPELAGRALAGVAQRGGQHTQKPARGRQERPRA